jgi:hypothetical protein
MKNLEKEMHFWKIIEKKLYLVRIFMNLMKASKNYYLERF